MRSNRDSGDNWYWINPPEVSSNTFPQRKFGLWLPHVSSLIWKLLSHETVTCNTGVSTQLWFHCELKLHQPSWIFSDIYSYMWLLHDVSDLVYFVSNRRFSIVWVTVIIEAVTILNYIAVYSQSSLFVGVRFLENTVNTENAGTFHLHLHYAWMPLLITKIIKNESRENKEAASPCWSPSSTLHSRRLKIVCLLRMAVNSREVPVNGKKWVTLYFARMSEPANTAHADSKDWLYLTKAVPSYLYKSCHFLDRNVCLEVGFSDTSWAICRGSLCVFLL